jgi:hypothetical protein
MTRIRLTAAAAAAAAAALALCQGCAPTSGAAARATPAAEAGLLVGLSSGRTLWIVPEGGAARLVATLPHLVVPRADGFWWVGTEQRCTVEELHGQGMELAAGVFLDRDEALYTVRAGDTARVTLGGIPCDEAAREAGVRAAARARAAADSAAAAGDSAALLALRADTGTVEGAGVEDCSRITQRVTFVSPAVVSVEHRYEITEACSPAKTETSFSYEVTRFATKERVSLRPLLTPAQKAVLLKGLAEADACRTDEERAIDPLDSAWMILRIEGRWVAGLSVGSPILCRGGPDAEPTVALPVSFTSDPPLPVAWAEIARRVPGLADAAGSPSGARLVLIAGDTLFLARVRGGALGEADLRVPVGYGDHFVMLRWASAAEAARWNRAIPALAAPVVLAQPPGAR